MLGILCGLEEEGAFVREIEGALVVCTAMHPERARLGAAALIQRGATRLLSFGMCGGLDPALVPGDIIIGSSVISAGGRWACDRYWNDVLKLWMLRAHMGPVLGLDVIVETAGDKRKAFERTRCRITDMESHHVAQAATRVRIPFTVVRVVVDSADVSMPPVTMLPLKDNGNIDFWSIFRSLVKKPGQIPLLLRMGKNMQQATIALGEAAKGVAGSVL